MNFGLFFIHKAKSVIFSNDLFDSNIAGLKFLITISICENLLFTVKSTRFFYNMGHCIYLTNSVVKSTFENVILKGNYFEYSTGKFSAITFTGLSPFEGNESSTFTNCSFVRNYYEEKDGAVLSFYESSNLEVFIKNCHFEDNRFDGSFSLILY